MASDWKEGDPDFWKDDEWRARDPLTTMRWYVGVALQIVRRSQLLKLRDRVLEVLPAPDEIIAMIDRDLVRIDTEPPENLLPEDLR